jgi:hypothetical protein
MLFNKSFETDGVSQTSWRVKDKIRNDKKLKRKIAKIEKNKCVKNEDAAPIFCAEFLTFL